MDQGRTVNARVISNQPAGKTLCRELNLIVGTDEVLNNFGRGAFACQVKDKSVVSGSAVLGVVTSAAGQPIVVVTAAQRVIASTPRQRIVFISTIDRIVAGTAVDRV